MVEDTDPFELWPGCSEETVETLSSTVYRQVLGDAESDKAAKDSKLVEISNNSLWGRPESLPLIAFFGEVEYMRSRLTALLPPFNK